MTKVTAVYRLTHKMQTTLKLNDTEEAQNAWDDTGNYSLLLLFVSQFHETIFATSINSFVWATSGILSEHSCCLKTILGWKSPGVQSRGKKNPQTSFFVVLSHLNTRTCSRQCKSDFVAKPQVAPWRLLLIGTIYQHTPANSDKYMLFSLFLITTICNEARLYYEFTYKCSLGRRKRGSLWRRSVMELIIWHSL